LQVPFGNPPGTSATQGHVKHLAIASRLGFVFQQGLGVGFLKFNMAARLAKLGRSTRIQVDTYAYNRHAVPACKTAGMPGTSQPGYWLSLLPEKVTPFGEVLLVTTE